MAGTPQYTEDEIDWVLRQIVNKIRPSIIQRDFETHFGRQVGPNQIRYIKNKYGKDPRYNCAVITARVHRMPRRRPLPRDVPDSDPSGGAREAPSREQEGHTAEQDEGQEAVSDAGNVNGGGQATGAVNMVPTSQFAVMSQGGQPVYPRPPPPMLRRHPQIPYPQAPFNRIPRGQAPIRDFGELVKQAYGAAQGPRNNGAHYPYNPHLNQQPWRRRQPTNHIVPARRPLFAAYMPQAAAAQTQQAQGQASGSSSNFTYNPVVAQGLRLQEALQNWQQQLGPAQPAVPGPPAANVCSSSYRGQQQQQQPHPPPPPPPQMIDPLLGFADPFSHAPQPDDDLDTWLRGPVLPAAGQMAMPPPQPPPRPTAAQQFASSRLMQQHLDELAAIPPGAADTLENTHHQEQDPRAAAESPAQGDAAVPQAEPETEATPGDAWPPTSSSSSASAAAGGYLEQQQQQQTVEDPQEDPAEAEEAVDDCSIVGNPAEAEAAVGCCIVVAPLPDEEEEEEEEEVAPGEQVFDNGVSSGFDVAAHHPVVDAAATTIDPALLFEERLPTSAELDFNLDDFIDYQAFDF